MNLRASILEQLSAPDYRPANDMALMRALKLPKKFRGRLLHEVRLLLANGRIQMVHGDRIALAGQTAPARGGKGDAAPDTITGRIQFRMGGNALVIPEAGQTKPAAGDAIHILSEDTGTALHGDRVVVAVNPRLSLRRDRKGEEQRGRVMRVVERGRETIVGTLKRIRSTFYVAADDPRFFHEIAVGDPASARLETKPQVGDKVVVKLYAWTNRHQLLEGEITEVLGQTFEPRAELLGIYRKYNLDPTFPEDVRAEVADLADTVQSAQLKGRRDYRDIPTFTIDPDDAKDFDDALSIEELPNGQTRVGVHIADVSTYVHPRTALDKEAQRRGNSTYLVGTVIPMLPEKLSNGLCSLVEAQDRLTKAVFLHFDQKGRLQHTEYAATVIRSRKRLTYKQAYALLFTDDLAQIRALPRPAKHQTGSTGRALDSLSDRELTDLQTWVRKLWSIASVLRKDRMAHGSLDLDMPETKIFVDEQGYADRLELIQNDESHQLIEEFMLAANEALARLTRTHRLPSLYRVHDEPDEDRLRELREQLATHGVMTGDLTLRSEITQLLRKLDDHPQGHILRTQLLRSLKKACYRASPDGHYGLHKSDYTHFTSPIRRYADLVVHRVLEYHLIQTGAFPKPDGYDFKPTAAGMDSMGEHISLTETNSQEAERESVKIKQLEYFEREMQKPEPASFEAIVTDVRSQGVFVELTKSMTFGFIGTSAMDGDFFVLNPAGDAFVGRKTRRIVGMGSKILVKVAQVDRVKRMIDFRLCIEESTTTAAGDSPDTQPRAPRQSEKGRDRPPRHPRKDRQPQPKARPSKPGKQKPGRPAKPERFAKAQPARAPQVVSEPVGRGDARPVFKLKKHATQPESSGSPFTPPGYVDSPRPDKKPRPAKSKKINPRGKTGKAGKAPAKPKPKPKSSRRPSKKQRRD
ncbi:MAG: RNB domain-containing ribonuclease [Verrucomicrobiota bacterium]